METIDWFIQGAGGALCAFLLVEWWRDHQRVATLARYLMFAVAGVGILLSAMFIGRTAGVTDQFMADSHKVEEEWKARSDALSKAFVAAHFSDEGATRIAMARAYLTTVRTGIVSTRSYVFLVALWLVVMFVATVPAPARRKSDQHAEGHADDNDS